MLIYLLIYLFILVYLHVDYLTALSAGQAVQQGYHNAA